MKLGTKLLFAAPIVLLIMGAVSPRVYAWDGGYGPNWGGCEGCGSGIAAIRGYEGGGGFHQGAYQNGYYAGIQEVTIMRIT